MISKITQDDLNKHQRWLNNDPGGERLVTDIGPVEIDANLSDANLSRADLSGANLSRADLSGANLSRADLSRANLSDADLSRADLSGANLSRADLSRANLSGAKNLSEYIENVTRILPDGTFTAYKKAKCAGHEVVLTLEIPADARRSNATGRKCRAEFAVLKAIEGIDWDYDGAAVRSSWDANFIYPAIGEKIVPDGWDENRWAECSHGIHFFITRYEAITY